MTGRPDESSGFYNEFILKSTLMAELVIYKTNEKIILWLHRSQKTQQWLADQLGQTKSAVNNKIRSNVFTAGDLIILKSIGCLED